jgi:hypothetical protein
VRLYSTFGGAGWTIRRTTSVANGPILARRHYGRLMLATARWLVRGEVTLHLFLAACAASGELFCFRLNLMTLCILQQNYLPAYRAGDRVPRGMCDDMVLPTSGRFHLDLFGG